MAEAGRIPAGDPACPPRCPGCQHREFSREESLRRKHSWLLGALERWSDRVEPVTSAPDSGRLGYRRKSCLRAEWGEGRWKFGLQVRKMTAVEAPRGRRPEYEVLDLPDCPVHSFELREAAAYLAERIPGDVPLCFLQFSGDIATLVIKSAALTERSEARLRSLWPVPGLRGLFVNLNPSAGDRVFSNKGWRLMAGEPTATFRSGSLLEGREFRYGAQSFQQLLPSLFEEALGAAAAHLAPTPGSSVLDLCSGIGVSLAHWRRMGARALGIELSGEAVACAEFNAGAGSCLRGRVEDRRPQAEQWLEAGGPGTRYVFANPPRTGLGPEVCSWIGEKVRPERLAYLSCSAGTLAKDLSVLTDSGYAVKKILPYDFFPQTHHVEILTLLARES